VRDLPREFGFGRYEDSYIVEIGDEARRREGSLLTVAAGCSRLANDSLYHHGFARER
jgi:hypothetical protein